MLEQIKAGQLLIVSRRRRNGLILCKRFYADFAGPGAAVGGIFDRDCEAIVPVGNLQLAPPTSVQEREEAYRIRRQWTILARQLTDSSSPEDRARQLLSQFENYFDPDIVAQVPDEALGLIVGIFPETIAEVRKQRL
ncbi:MAG: hypothetical protein HC824_09620 [Synechococcales cyanobacterium RM1_1_8]|nr:hypothetical protein [Synechococcales cyanobacterium RM1_1_8]